MMVVDIEWKINEQHKNDEQIYLFLYGRLLKKCIQRMNKKKNFFKLYIFSPVYGVNNKTSNVKPMNHTHLHLHTNIHTKRNPFMIFC